MPEAVVGKLAEALGSSAPLLCAWVGMNEPAVAETLAREAFDAVVLNMQHGAVDFAGASRGILSVALAGKPAIVRITCWRFRSCESRAGRGRGRYSRADDQQPGRR